jgi:hypothetical protein
LLNVSQNAFGNLPKQLFLLAIQQWHKLACVAAAWIKKRRLANHAPKKPQRSNGLRRTAGWSRGLFVHKRPNGSRKAGDQTKTPPGGGVSMSK